MRQFVTKKQKGTTFALPFRQKTLETIPYKLINFLKWTTEKNSKNLLLRVKE
jgi:hypothetical protein